MSDVQFENFALRSGASLFDAIWKLTRAMKKAGWTYKSSSNGTATDITGTATNDKWGGNTDPATDTYPTALDTVIAWWNAQGPTTQKLSMLVAPTGSFVRGEKVTQAGTSAEGELVGYDFDGTLNTTTVASGSNGVALSTFTGSGVLNVLSAAGYPASGGYVALPGLSGAIVSYTSTTSTTFAGCTLVSGAGTLATGQTVNGANGHAVIIPRCATPSSSAFNGTGVITGAISGASFTPTALNTFVMEIVFTKTTNLTQGAIWIQRVDATVESASRFSVLASSAGVSATVPPGGGGTGNAFPTAGSTVVLGTQTGTFGVNNWWVNTSGLGKAQIVASNIIGATGVSPDGTFFIVQGDTVTSTQAQLGGYFRLDDSEDGDVDPFAAFWNGDNGTFNRANVRLTATALLTLSTSANGNFYDSVGDRCAWRAWRRRGWNSSDAFLACCTMILGFGSGGTGSALINNNASPETVACSYSTKRLRDKVYIVSADNTNKCRKGSLRWASAIQGNTTFDTFDSKARMMIMPGDVTSPGIILGLFDGVTTPSQT